VCVATVVLALGLVPGVATAAVTNAAANNQKMLEFMNAERAARGLSPLARDSRLDALAQSWANKMAAARSMYHPSPPQAMTGAGYRSGAQNLAWHDTVLTGAWAHNFWMNSAPHRKNILDPAFTHTGIAMACNPSGGRYPYVFATVEFGGNSTPLSSTPAASPHVAGSQSIAGAGCDGAATAPPAPPPPAPAPPPPAPAAAPVASAKAAAKPSPSKPSPSASSAKKAASPSPPAKASASPKPKPSPSASPSASAAAALAVGAQSPSPTPLEASQAAQQPQKIDSLAVADSHNETSSAPLVALIAGLSGILLMSRVASRRRRPRPKHAISRH
jgi:hypothetical protein